MTKRFALNRSEAKLMGVGAGIADYSGVDPLLVRLGLAASLLIVGPITIVFYVLTAWLAPAR